MTWIDLISGPAQAANDSAMSAVEKRAERAMSVLSEHKQRDKALPCGHLHFDVVEALLAEHAKGDIPFQAVKTFARIMFVGALSGALAGGAMVAAVGRLVDKITNDAPRVTAGAVDHNSLTRR
jgi:queuine/archaeosine tRNA-ribosyltransferase